MFDNARKLALPAVVVAAAAALSVAPASAAPQSAPTTARQAADTTTTNAQAHRPDRCAYPNVCLYRDARYFYKTAQFNRITNGWHRITPRQYWVHNTRQHNVVEFRLTNGQRQCIPPKFKGKLQFRNHPNGVRITNKTHCALR